MKLRKIHLRERLGDIDLVTYKEIKDGTVKEYYIFTREELEEFWQESIDCIGDYGGVGKTFDDFMKEQGD